MRAASLLDAAELKHLESVIHELERQTEGEIVLALVSECDEYGSVGWRLGVALSVLATLCAVIALPTAPFWIYFALQSAALLLGHGLARLEPVRRALLPADLVEVRSVERARRAFAEHGLERTRGRTGILILVATLERRVVVLGDSGIDAVLDPDESWPQVIALAAEGLRAGRPAEGLEAALRRCGEMLRRHVPSVEPRIDQLSNAVIVED